MSYSNSQTPFAQSSERSSDAIAIGASHEYSMNENEQQGQFDSRSPSRFDNQPPHNKRPRTDDNNSLSNPSPYGPPMSGNALNASANRGAAGIFFKTRVCLKLRQGMCRNGESCNFAHGEGDLRQPPSNWKELVNNTGGGVREQEIDRSENWDEDQRIIQRMKLCKKFYNGEECPYGDRCNFLHADPAQFRENAVRPRESSIISIGTNGSSMEQGFIASSCTEGSNKVPAMVGNARIMKIYRKTKMCSKWESGQCPFVDKCNFAHGMAELHMPVARSEGETGTWTKPRAGPVTEACKMMTNVPAASERGEERKRMFKNKVLPRKINTIYGDWLDSMPMGPRQTEN